jgi:hypothetical protein
MRSLMPTTAKGANVFHASQGDCMRAISPELEDDKASEHDSKEVPSQQSAIPWSPSPSPKACSPALLNNQHTPFPLVFVPTPPNGKHKHSALSAVNSCHHVTVLHTIHQFQVYQTSMHRDHWTSSVARSYSRTFSIWPETP